MSGIVALHRVTDVERIAEIRDWSRSAHATLEPAERLFYLVDFPHVPCGALPHGITQDCPSVAVSELIRALFRPKAKMGYLAIPVREIMHENI